MEKNAFQQTKDMIMNLTNMQGSATENDRKAVQEAIQSAHQNATPEEQEQLQQLEQQLKQDNMLG